MAQESVAESWVAGRTVLSGAVIHRYSRIGRPRPIPTSTRWPDSSATRGPRESWSPER
jgi:hypothetical protein